MLKFHQIKFKKITNNLIEIEKKMDSTYGEFNDLEFDQDYMNLFKTFHSSKNMIMLESDKFERKDSSIISFSKTNNDIFNEYNELKSKHYDEKKTAHANIAKIKRMKAECNSSKWITLNENLKTNQQSEDWDANSFAWNNKPTLSKINPTSNRKVNCYFLIILLRRWIIEIQHKFIRLK